MTGKKIDFINLGAKLILGVMSAGIIGVSTWAIGTNSTVDVHSSQIAEIKKTQEDHKEEIKELRKIARTINWYLIERNGLTVPPAVLKEPSR